MKQWTREHDKAIAEKVEKLEIRTEYYSAGSGERLTTWNRYFYRDPDWGMIEIPNYTEHKHLFRALEKWRNDAAPNTKRYYSYVSQFDQEQPLAILVTVGSDGAWVDEKENWVEHPGKDALAWALYAAVAG